MTITYKRWTGLGLTAVLIAGCGDSEPTAAEKAADDQTVVAAEDTTVASDAAPPAVEPVESGEAGEGEGGEAGEGSGGEGGEGGIDIDRAASDPVVFRAGLAVVEAHVIAARDAYAMGRKEAAAEMFAHPVAEVLVDMEAVLTAQGVQPFDPLLIEASEAALGDTSQEEIDSRSEKIITALEAAAQQAPESNRSEGAIEARVAADQIERAVEQYRYAAEGDAYEPYLDGYGFYKTAAAIQARSGDAIRADDALVADRIEGALALLATAYPTAERPDALDVDQSALLAASSQLKLTLRN